MFSQIKSEEIREAFKALKYYVDTRFFVMLVLILLVSAVLLIWTDKQMYKAQERHDTEHSVQLLEAESHSLALVARIEELEGLQEYGLEDMEHLDEKAVNQAVRIQDLEAEISKLQETQVEKVLPSRYSVKFSGGVATRFNGTFSIKGEIIEDPEGNFEDDAAARDYMRSIISEVSDACKLPGAQSDYGWQGNVSWIYYYEGQEPLTENCYDLFRDLNLPVSERVPEFVLAQLEPSIFDSGEHFLVIDGSGLIIGEVDRYGGVILKDQPCWSASLEVNGFDTDNGYAFVDTNYFGYGPGKANSNVLFNHGFHHIQRPKLKNFCGSLGLSKIQGDLHEIFGDNNLTLTAVKDGYVITFGDLPAENMQVKMLRQDDEFILVNFSYSVDEKSIDESWAIKEGSVVEFRIVDNVSLVTFEDGELIALEVPNYEGYRIGSPILEFSPNIDGIIPWYGAIGEPASYYRLDQERVVDQFIIDVAGTDDETE